MKHKDCIALFKVLEELKTYQRTIILSNLDSTAAHCIYLCTRKVLNTFTFNEKDKKLMRKALSPFKDQFRFISLKTREKRKLAKKRRILASLAGPMNLIFAASIPILLESLKKKGKGSKVVKRLQLK